MSQLAEGIFPCTVLSGEAGEIDGVIKARINVKFDDGPSKGRTGTYEDTIDVRSALYVSRSMKAVGWAGQSVASFAKDVEAWIARTGGKSTAEVRHIEIKRGKRYDKWAAGGFQGPAPVWDKVASIGRAAKPMTEAKGEVLSDADDALRRAMQEDGTAATDDFGSAPDEPGQLANDDIPFATCAMSDYTAIAKVLR